MDYVLVRLNGVHARLLRNHVLKIFYCLNGRLKPVQSTVRVILTLFIDIAPTAGLRTDRCIRRKAEFVQRKQPETRMMHILGDSRNSEAVSQWRLRPWRDQTRTESGHSELIRCLIKKSAKPLEWIGCIGIRWLLELFWLVETARV